MICRFFILFLFIYFKKEARGRGESFVVISILCPVPFGFWTDMSLRLLLYSGAPSAHRTAVKVLVENAGEHSLKLVAIIVERIFLLMQFFCNIKISFSGIKKGISALRKWFCNIRNSIIWYQIIQGIFWLSWKI